MQKKLGVGSIHFPSEGDESNDPYVSFESSTTRETFSCLDDGSMPPPRLYFAPGYHFHKKTNTFYGTIDLDNLSTTWYGANKWEYIIQFSSRFTHACGGCIIMHRKHINQFSPLDGCWSVSTTNAGEFRTFANDKVEVVSGAYSHETFGKNYHINFSNISDVHVSRKIGNKTIMEQRLENFDFNKRPNGPLVGEKISWISLNSDSVDYTWTRESIYSSNTSIPPKVVVFGLNNWSLQRYSPTPNEVEVPTYNSETLWGNTFIQASTIGQASYHFVDPNDENGAYISYESEQTLYWGSLDDGSPLPPRVPFRNITFDESARIFRGVIAWKEDYGTTWNGAIRWEYEMVFDSTFSTIESGGVRNFLEGEVEGDEHRYGPTLQYSNAKIAHPSFLENFLTSFGFR